MKTKFTLIKLLTVTVVVILFLVRYTQAFNSIPIIVAILGFIVIILAASAFVVDYRFSRVQQHLDTKVRDPQLTSFLFSDYRSAALWLVIRMYVGFSVLESALFKLADASWMGDGSALKSMWELSLPTFSRYSPEFTLSTYRSIIEFLIANNLHVSLARIFVYSEFFIACAIIIGFFVGIASFFMVLMRVSFLAVGFSVTSPLIFTAGILLMLAWKVAGRWGADRYLLPLATYHPKNEHDVIKRDPHKQTHIQ